MALKKACIVCNGEALPEPLLAAHVSEADLVIAADGGVRQLLEAGLKPNLYIGDMDSSDVSVLSSDDSVEIVTYDRDKNESDSELAVNHAIRNGADRIILLSASGSRLDHTFSNLSLLSRYPGRLFLVDEGMTCFALSDDIGSCHIECGKDKLVSVFPFGDAVSGFSISGTKWELDSATLSPGSLGLSNMSAEQTVSISIRSGCLMVFAECSSDNIRIINKFESE